MLYTENDYGYRYANLRAVPDKATVAQYKKTHNIRTEGVHNMCVACQIRQIEEKGSFDVPCSFVPDRLPSGSGTVIKKAAAQSGISVDRATKLYAAQFDPVIWAEVYLGFDDSTREDKYPWSIYYYQKDQLRCTAKRMVLRQGRRCVTPDTRVLMADASWIPISEVRPGDVVITKDGFAEVLENLDNGLQPVYRIQTEGGFYVDATDNHPFWRNGWVSIETGLSVGDRISSIMGDVEIEEIKPLGTLPTRDLVVADHHSFIANGLVCHNSGKSFGIALKLLHLAFTTQVEKGRYPYGHEKAGQPIITGPMIVIVTPFSSQLENIFNELRSLIFKNTSGELLSMIKSRTRDQVFVKTPNYKMELLNGGSIRGFVSGIGVKTDDSTGGSLRGASANIVYLDEMDMIPEQVIRSVVQPLLLQPGGVTLIGSSTPIGKRGTFYTWATTAKQFKSYYLPSTVLETWDEVKEEAESNSSEAFAREYMAHFVESSSGVFRPSLVQAARADYSYEETDFMNPKFWVKRLGVRQPRENSFVCIGIDWNGRAGTEFFVVAYVPSIRKWIALEAVNIPSSEFSAQRWKEEVRRLNFKWKPDYIYADKGYGHHIIEDLLYEANRLKLKPSKTAIDIETVKLSERLKAYSFGSNIELRDPSTNQLIKKNAKAFLVENATRILEDKLFMMPYEDEELRKQMLNYILVKRLANGRPVYGMDNPSDGDHRLDAWMLSLAGLVLEESVYAGIRASQPQLLEDEENPHSVMNLVRGLPGHERRERGARSKIKPQPSYLLLATNRVQSGEPKSKRTRRDRKIQRRRRR